MAKKTIEKYFSDLSGDPIENSDPSLTFAVGGDSYEMDVTPDERAQFLAALEPYTAAARRVSGGGRRRRGRSAATTAGGPAPREIRAWAAENGYTVSERGRVPAAVLEAYDAAH